MLDKPTHRSRPSQPPGKTFLRHSPNGKRLYVGGCANFARSYNTGDLGEPDIIYDTHEDARAITAGDNYFILGCEDGTVCQYDMESRKLDKMLVRCSLPIRDMALSPDENWVAVSSE